MVTEKTGGVDAEVTEEEASEGTGQEAARTITITSGCGETDGTATGSGAGAGPPDTRRSSKKPQQVGLDLCFENMFFNVCFYLQRRRRPDPG